MSLKPVRGGPGWKRRIEFPVVRLVDGEGKNSFAARITCGQCGSYSDNPGRGNIDNEVFFERHGWLIGKNRDRDRCPACRRKSAQVRARSFGEVVKRVDEIMTNIKQQAAQVSPEASHETSREMSREDGRLLSRAIEDHWDEQSTSYQIGWSDKRIADDMSVPVDWVKTIRERDFGGTGDEPGLALFLAEQIAVKREIGELTTVLGMAQKDLESSTAFQGELARKMEGYRNGHRRLLERIEKLDVIVVTLQKEKR